ncbi:hypothetical protein KFK09_002125 [Dendrobium nobile]|uniref:RNase H type-1 domain-containing protein n=1 Tax=Dendrobium nobile TaxID=94219 RepID=A0A8T3C732_DENNO|nr:hypothetical protein KFK09_002125 [Dendrobium nobile]
MPSSNPWGKVSSLIHGKIKGFFNLDGDVQSKSPSLSFKDVLSGNPMHVLHALGSVFGRPLQTDQATASRTRPSVARVLVEVDISKKMQKRFGLDPRILEKVDFSVKIPIALDEEARPVLGPSNIIQETNVDTHLVMPDNCTDIIAKTFLEGNKLGNEKEKLPNLYVSIDSMLQNTSDPHLPATIANLVLNVDSEISEEGCEEGEFIPFSGMEIGKENHVNNCDKGKSGFEGSISKHCEEEENYEEENFIKIDRKKGKKNKETLSSTPRSTRAQASSKVAENDVMELKRLYLLNPDIINLYDLNNAKIKLFALHDQKETYWQQKATTKFVVEVLNIVSFLLLLMGGIMASLNPPKVYDKLNTDGSVGVSIAGMGGIIRDNFGEVMVAYAGPLYPCKVIFAELIGLAKGLEICQSRGYANVKIEVDALY